MYEGYKSICCSPFKRQGSMHVAWMKQIEDTTLALLSRLYVIVLFCN
jgi:hypothetical protein